MMIENPVQADVAALKFLWQEAFSDTPFFVEIFYRTAFSCDRCRCVRKNGSIAAALYWFPCTWNGRRIAYLYGVATAKAFRSQGICKRLMEDTHVHLKALGFAAVILVPAGASLYAFYERMGYRICSSIGEIHCEASGEAVGLQRITADEFAALRRAYLPANAVLQEHEQLALLEQTEEFYKGENFLLIGHGEDEGFVGVELLGDVSAAPKILGSLRFDKGMFRIAGEGKPFAMGFSLCEGIVLSDLYFGIAFDL